MRSIKIIIVAISMLIVLNMSGCASEETDISISSAAVSIDNMYVGSGQLTAETEETKEIKEIAETTEDDIVEETAEEVDEVIVDCVAVKDAKPGDYVQFGKYEQDADKSNGAEAIEWLVLEQKDDSILLLSRYIIEKKPFNETDKAVEWSQSTLRKWLNEDFVKIAFDKNESEQILVSDIDNPGSLSYFADFKYKAGTAAGKKTKDKVFLLSYKEVIDYFDLSKVDKYYIYAGKDLITTSTAATGLKNDSMSVLEYETFYKDEAWPEDCVGVEGCGWYLRSRGINTDDVMSVGYDGALRGQYYEYGAAYESVTYEGGVRPAMWIKR